MTDEELKKTVRCAVREGIDDALTRYGIDTEDPTAMQADMVYLRKSRQGSDEVLKWVKRSAIATVVASTLAAIWHGIKAMINNGS